MAFEFDVFLSHNSKDKPAVETIARSLQDKYGLKCWLDKWNLVPGESWQEALERGLDQSATVAVFVGPNEISPWENEEMRSAIETRVHDTQRRVIPVLLPGAADSRDLQLPRFLSRLTWVDFRSGLHDEEALYRLYCGIKGIPPQPDGWKKKDEDGGGPAYGSYIPFVRNTNFTGREEDLEKLAENLLKAHATNTVISQAVTGMGGLGKTQLAVEFAYRYGRRFKGVHWLDLRDPQALDGAIVLCGNEMGYNQKDQRELIASTMKTWAEDGPRLLILDNFEDIEHTNRVLARFQYPSLRLLVTSRRRDFPKSSGLQVQKLGVFSEKESAAFLENILEQPETMEARKEMADTLGCLPLALELAASYINITNIGIEGYLQVLADLPNLEAEQKAWLKEQNITTPTEHDQSLFGTFEISWHEVQDETYQLVFMLAGYCAPNTPIPLEIFKKSLELEDKLLSKALYRLNALGLLPNTDKLPTIHPLLAAYARTLSSKELLEKLADKLAVLARRANDQMDQTGSPGWFVPLRPHVLSTADFAEKADVSDAAHLLGNLGYYLRTIADYQGAKDAFERALKIEEATYGPDHPDVAVGVNNLGKVLHDQGDLAGAKAAFERALKIAKAAYGPDHPDVGVYASNLGLVLQAQGDLGGAKTNYELALKIAEDSYGPDAPEVTVEVFNLGLVLHDLGDLTGARAHYERALKIDEAARGPDHPDVARDVRNLGLVLQAQGDLAAAKANLERALKIDEAIYGPEHPKVARDINNFGLLLQDLGDLEGAKEALKRALQIYMKFLPEGHPNIRHAQENLDAVLRELGE
jgi:tetratricopeptide (TPR) repeat protein